MGWGKKIGIGCVVFLCFFLIVITIAYRLFISPITSAIGNMTGQGGEVAEIIKDINQKYPFQVSSNVNFDEKRFSVFLEARESGFSVFEGYQKKVSQKEKVDLKDIFHFFKMFANVRLVHAEYLKDKQMSMNEYMWFSRNITNLAYLSSMPGSPKHVKLFFQSDILFKAFHDFESAFDNFPIEDEQKKDIMNIQIEFDEWKKRIENNQIQFQQALSYWTDNNIIIAKKYKKRLIHTFVMVCFGI